MDEKIFDIKESLRYDESIEKYEYHEYTPVTGTNLNHTGEIRIVIETQDLFTHPSESYLIIEGQLTKTDGTAYTDEESIALCNNGLMYLFQDIKYDLSGQEIEKINYPGHATTMLGILKYPGDFSTTHGLNMLWCKDENDQVDGNPGFTTRFYTLIKRPDPKGTFSFKIPLKHIFGFAEDYSKVIYGFRQQLTLNRQTDDYAIMRLSTVAAGKVRLDKISWFMPHVLPADQSKLQLYKIIENKTKLDVGFRMHQCDTISVPQTRSFDWRLAVKSSPEKPRYIIIAFQTENKSNQVKNPAIFDNLNLRNIHVNLNSRRYPEVDYNISFPKQQFARVYSESAGFRSKFYGMDELLSNPNISPSEFKNVYPIFLIDVSKQSERLKHSITDITIKAEFGENVPPRTNAYAIVISDKILSFQSDGQKMSVIQS